MGMFGYICAGCDNAIRGGEKAVLKHYRHGELLGQTVGEYNYYGGVEEDNDYRGHHNGINGHDSICTSEFEFLDSKEYDGKIYKETPMTWMVYRRIKVQEGMEDLCDEMYKEWDSLPYYEKKEVLSGVGAWHECCYKRASEEQKNNVILSKGDPDQAWGKPRKKYM